MANKHIIFALILAIGMIARIHGFVQVPLCSNHIHSSVYFSDNDDNNNHHSNDEEVIGDDDNLLSSSKSSIRNVEKAWRYIKKPLLRIGSKGTTKTHGNSLRQLLEFHTAVKVKINNPKFETTKQSLFEELRDYAMQSGAPEGIELIQSRAGERVILFGMPGTMERIQNGEFPPPPPPTQTVKNDINP